MRIVLFCHSLVSDWNLGNAHFLRGVVAELIDRGHVVSVYEPTDSSSRRHLLAEAGPAAIERFHRAYPTISSHIIDFGTVALDEVLDAADLVIVHQWNPQGLVAAIGRHRARQGRYTLLFHDTHHRSVSAPDDMARYDLHNYDGVLAFGEVIRQRYLALGWARRAWTWHEAADTRVFTPRPPARHQADLIWIGNWGDEERSGELRDYLIGPVGHLRLEATVYGVGYPDAALTELAQARMTYGGWLPNFEAPAAYARHLMTVHVPRRPYVASLPGIPTIRLFEALACGIPLVSTEWADVEGLFSPGDDFLVATTPTRMRTLLLAVREDPHLRRHLQTHGLATIHRRHTCAHRVDELMRIVREVRQDVASEVLSA